MLLMKISSLLSKFESTLCLPDKSTSARGTSWADGLRGVAALGVVASHLTLSFWTEFVRPCDDGIDGPSQLFQRPIFRLVVQGQAWVAVFFMLMGFVNPLKPLKQAHYGDVEGALTILARNALTRTARLVLPAAAVTAIAWLFCQLGFFDLARESSAYWIQVNSPDPSESWRQALWDLFQALLNTWIKEENIYDQPQWALPHLLRGSMYIFVLILITITMTPKFRIYAILFAYSYSWVSGESLLGSTAAGVLLSELYSSAVRSFESRHTRILAVVGAILGLFLMSFPSEFQDWKPWTRQLSFIGHLIFPENADMGRYWCGIGAQVLCFSVYFSPDLRALFNMPFLTWLGSISFSLYLLHGPLIRSLLVWMIFGPQWLVGIEYVNGKMPLPGAFTMVIVLPCFGAILLAVSALWTYEVEPYFGKATNKLQEWACGGQSGLPSQRKTHT